MHKHHRAAPLATYRGYPDRTGHNISLPCRDWLPPDKKKGEKGTRCQQTCCIYPSKHMAIVYAASGITEIVAYVKIAFVLCGVFLFAFGFVKLALSLINDNPGERVNSIIWLSVGVALVVIKFTVIDNAIDPIITSINQHGHGW